MTAWPRQLFGSAQPHEARQPALRVALNMAPFLALAVSCAGLIVGGLSLSLNSLDQYRLEVLGALAVALVLLALYGHAEIEEWSRELGLMLAATCVAAAVLAYLPEYMYGYYVNGVIHRSIFTAVILLCLCSWTTSASLYYVLGATPTARDWGRVAVILLPIALVLFLYAAILARVANDGFSELTIRVLTHAYHGEVTPAGFVSQAGMRNHILGTLLLIVMTGAIALPIGVGTGIFVSEYGGILGQVASISVSMLRSISVFILAVTAFTLVRWSTAHSGAAHADSLLSELIRGYWVDSNGFTQAEGGSYVLASVFLALLVIPVIARSTEEGCRSVPHDIREGAQALGATEGHSLTRIILPWALPNIVTGLLLGLAEAAGSVTVIMFISGTGEHGVAPLKGATSLAFLIFDAHPGKGPQLFTNTMSPYEFAAALLLLAITFTLTLGALALRSRFARRYRAGISYE